MDKDNAGGEIGYRRFENLSWVNDTRIQSTDRNNFSSYFLIFRIQIDGDEMFFESADIFE